jgi:hypothetical protein
LLKTAVSQQGRAPARSRTPGDTDQHQLFRKRHPRLRQKKISGGTVRDDGRDARDIMLGLAKTCMKLTGDRSGRKPSYQAPAITQGCIILSPVRDPMTLAGNVVSTFRMKLERHDPLPT